MQALNRLLYHCFQALEKPKTATRVLFLEFTKTFDGINPKLLEDKERIGVREALIPWITSYLRKRKHSSKIENISKKKSINGGNPQENKI